VVCVTLYYGSINQLLQLDVIQVATHHHLQHLEELSIRNKTVVVYVVDLEGKTELILVRRAG